MACCAFALYLVTQLLLPLRWLRDRLIGAPPQVASASVAWTPNMAPNMAPGMVAATATVTPAGPARGRRILLAIIAAELVGVGVAAAPVAAADDAALFTQFHQSLCASVFGSPA